MAETERPVQMHDQHHICDLEKKMGNVAQTARMVAAMRAEENEHPDAVLRDQWAALLAGRDAQECLAKHPDWMPPEGSRIMALRTRIVDDDIKDFADAFEPGTKLQVVNVGAGMDTRPWRLDGVMNVRWFEVDLPEVLHLKQALLNRHGACLGYNGPEGPPPLKCHSYAAVCLDLTEAKDKLAPKLKEHGFEAALPTIWVAEGVIMYMEKHSVEELLRAVAACGSHSGGRYRHRQRMVVTVAKRNDLLQLPNVPEDVRQLWKCALDDLEEGDAFEKSGWNLHGTIRGIPELSRERYGPEVLPKPKEGKPSFEELVVCLEPPDSAVAAA